MGSFDIWGHGLFGPPTTVVSQTYQPCQAPAPRAPLLGFRLGPIGQPVPSSNSNYSRVDALKTSPIACYSSVEPVSRVDDFWNERPWRVASPSPEPVNHFQMQQIQMMGDHYRLRYPDDDDHPSFARPPHRAVEKPKQQQAPSRFVGVVSIPSPDSINKDDGIVVPDSYPIPAPPPLAQSAAPLSDFAAELVWNRCFVRQVVPRKQYFIAQPDSPYDPDTFPSILMSRKTADDRDGRNMVERSGIGNFGAIGVEVQARRAASREKAQGRPHPAPLPAVTSKAGIKPAFRRWCKQVLEATLLSPQVLMLAMMYVDAVTGKDVFGEGVDQMTPYKMMIAALVLANKTLDDHSYKNSTFANVSSMTNVEVNNVEVALFLALDFNTIPHVEAWLAWLHDAIEFGDRMGFKLSGTKVDDLILALRPTFTPEIAEHVEVPQTPVLPRTVSCFYREACKDVMNRRPGRMASLCGICKGDVPGRSDSTLRRRFGQELPSNQLVIGY